MSGGRRILLLLPYAPRLDGTHGGSRAMAQLLWTLGAHHELAVLYLRSRGEPEMDEALGSRCVVAEAIGREPSGGVVGRVGRRVVTAVAQLAGTPRWAAEWKVGAMARRAAALAREWRPEVIQLEYHLMGQYARALGAAGAARVLVEYEPGVLAATAPGLLARRNAAAWARYERRVMADVDAVVVFTERDRDAVAPLAGGTPVWVIPLAVPLPDRALDPVGGTPPSVVFVGNFIHPPNVDAALWLAGSIFPLVRSRHPEATLQIVGADPPPAVRAAAGTGVILTGRVPDVMPYLDRAALVVAPLRLGGGMRLKVLEALVAGKALVATTRAVEGLTLRHGQHAAIADSAEAIAAAIVQMLDTPTERAAMAGRARAWARERLNPERWRADYERLYATLLAAREGSR